MWKQEAGLHTAHADALVKTKSQICREPLKIRRYFYTHLFVAEQKSGRLVASGRGRQRSSYWTQQFGSRFRGTAYLFRQENTQMPFLRWYPEMLFKTEVSKAFLQFPWGTLPLWASHPSVSDRHLPHNSPFPSSLGLFFLSCLLKSIE